MRRRKAIIFLLALMQANSENGRDDKGAAEIAAYKKSYAGFFKAKPVNM